MRVQAVIASLRGFEGGIIWQEIWQILKQSLFLVTVSKMKVNM